MEKPEVRLGLLMIRRWGLSLVMAHFRAEIGEPVANYPVESVDDGQDDLDQERRVGTHQLRALGDVLVGRDLAS